MTSLTSAKTITHISWSPESGENTLLYLEDRENIIVQSVGGSKKTVAQGFEPVWLGSKNIAFVKNHEIWAVGSDGSNERKLFDKSAGFANTGKGAPLATKDGKKLLVTIRDVQRSQTNWVPDAAYPVRHFYAIGDPETKEFTPINSWAYGGKAMWFNDGERFAHHEFDATGGAQLHINKIDGEEIATYRGYLPQLSPDGKHVACVTHAFDAVQVIDIEKGGEDAVQRIELPKDLAGGRFNNAALWLDDERLLIEAKGIILELFTDKKKKAARRVEVDIARRGIPTMAISADRKKVAYEGKKDGQSEIVVIDVADWLSKSLPEPKAEESEA